MKKINLFNRRIIQLSSLILFGFMSEAVSAAAPNPTIYDGDIMSAKLAVNQLGYSRYANKSVELWTDKPLAQYLDASLKYKFVIVDWSDQFNPINIVETPLYQPWELSRVGGHKEITTADQPGIPDGNLYHYRWDFSALQTDGQSYMAALHGFNAAGVRVHDFAISELFMINHSGGRAGTSPLTSVYQKLTQDSLKYYDFHRIGTPAMEGTSYARKSLHGAAVPCYKDWCGDGIVGNGNDPLIGGGTAWSDAGDFGIYPVNHAIAAWQMLNAVEFSEKFSPGSFRVGVPGAYIGSPIKNDPDGVTTINGRSQPLVDEAAIGSNYMLGFNTLPNSKLIPHRITNMDWGMGFDAWCLTKPNPNTAPACKTDEDKVLPNGNIDGTHGSQTEAQRIESYKRRAAAPGSTAATYATCRTSAHLARLLHKDSTKQTAASTWMTNATNSYKRTKVNGNSNVLFPKAYENDWLQIPDGGGPYSDEKIDDDQFACLTELYLAYYEFGYQNQPPGAAKDQFTSTRTALIAHPLYIPPTGHTRDTFDWKNVTKTGYMSLVVANNDLPAADITLIKNYLMTDGKNIASATLFSSGSDRDVNPAGLATTEFSWGSNSSTLNAGVLETYASALSKEAGNATDRIATAKGALEALDYIFGQNALRMSFVTGYGEIAESDTHDRWAWYLHKRSGLAYPNGWLSGGPTGDALSCFGGTENRIADGRRPYERATPFYYKNGPWQAYQTDTVDANLYGNFNPFAPKISDLVAKGTLLSADGVYKVYGMTVAQGGNGLDAKAEVKRLAKELSTFVAAPAFATPAGWKKSLNQNINYAAPETAPDAWCSKENTVNYNSALLWMSTVAQQVLPSLVTP